MPNIRQKNVFLPSLKSNPEFQTKCSFKSKKIINGPIDCILQKKKRSSPVIVIKATTIYETIILKPFKNSVIIQSAKQLVFYEITDFIVAGYRVKLLQHIFDLNKPKTQMLF